jgi:hypothetical protein
MPLTLRPLTIGPPIYAHLTDYEVMEDGESIGRIKQEREEEPRKLLKIAQHWLQMAQDVDGTEN